jgi:hypothetical protein
MAANSHSPMLRHAIESFEHGVLHFLDGTDLGRKFALLHIDHAIELILQEKVARIGHSIYRKDGKTIGVHEAYAVLQNVAIPEQPRLEDLHDFRNIVQHKGLTPDALTTEFYVGEAYRFIKRFLNDELSVTISSCLPHAYIRAMEGDDLDNAGIIEEVRRKLIDAEQLFSSGSYEMAVVSSFVAMEIAVRKLFSFDRPTPLVSHLRYLVDLGKVDASLWVNYKNAAALRNKAAHTGGGISRADARKAIDDIHGLIDALPKELP